MYIRYYYYQKSLREHKYCIHVWTLYQIPFQYPSVFKSGGVLFIQISVRIQTFSKFKNAGAAPVLGDWFGLIYLSCFGDCIKLLWVFIKFYLSSWVLLHYGSSTKEPFIRPSVLSLKFMPQKVIKKWLLFYEVTLIINERLKKRDLSNMLITILKLAY